MNKQQIYFYHKLVDLIGSNLISNIDSTTKAKTKLKTRCTQCKVIHTELSRNTIFGRFRDFNLTTECKKCSYIISRKKTKQTNLKRYGTEIPQKCQLVKDKMAKTNLIRYGHKAPAQNKEVVNKMQVTNLLRYASINAIGNSKIQQKCINTSITNFGTTHPMKSQIIKERLKQTFTTKFGVDNPSKVKFIITKGLISKNQSIKEINLPKIIEDLTLNPNQIISSKEFQEKHNTYYVTIFRWLRESNNEHLIPTGHQSSSPEKELSEWVQSITNLDVITNTRSIIKPKELDIYIPEKKLGIEYHGLYWHSREDSKRSHIMKRQLADDLNISLIQIYANEWEHQRDIVKSLISNKLNVSVNRIFARKTEVRRVSLKDTTQFLVDNHLMGPSYGTKNLGLYYGNDLVCLLTYKKCKESVEISRFCSLLNTVVIGGLSKLIKQLPKKQLISFVDLRYANGNSLLNLGFELISVTQGWKWTDYNQTFNRRICRANMDDRNLTEVEHAKELGLSKIYDAGQAKFVFKI